MSFSALYEVTRSLRMLLHSQIILRSASAVVTLLPPGDNLPDVSGVNLYLYRVLESPFSRNRDWPGDRVTPPSRQPVLGLQLSYLLTPLGTKPDNASFQLGDDAHTMLGAAMLVLHENPVLNDVHLPGFDADRVLPDFLLNSYEPIRIHLVPTGLEELSKIWATINKPYRMSVAYEVSLVQLAPTAPPPVSGAFVTSTGVTLVPLDPPRLSELAPASGALARIAGGAVVPNDLRISGFGLSFPGQEPLVRVGGQLAAVQRPPAPTDTALTVVLPSGLDAGPQVDVRVSLNRRTSTPLVFTVSPWLADLTPIRTALDPGRGPADMKLTLRGNGFTGSPRSVRFDGPGGTSNVTAFDPGGNITQATVNIPTGLANGVYDVRIVLNDAASSVSNPRTLEVIPRLDSPVGVAVVAEAIGDVHRLTLNGARLNGADVRLVIDGATYQVGANGAAGQIVYTLGRLLAARRHTVAVNVDGHLSRTVEFVV